MHRTLLALTKGLLAPGCLLLTSVQCDGDSAGPSFLECAGPVVLSISSGLTPELAWRPRCSLFALDIHDLTTDTSTWSLLSLYGTGNALDPPIKFGVVPPGVEEVTPPVPLSAGHEYRISLFRLDTSDPKVPVVYQAADSSYTP